MAARLTGTIALLLALPLLTGCLSQYQPPRFEIVGATVSEQTDDGFLVTFTLRGENVNDVPLPLKRVNYSVDLGGKRVFSGRRESQATLPRFSEQMIKLPAAVPADLMSVQTLKAETRFSLRGDMTYETPGLLAEILFDAGVRRPTVTFTKRGTLRPEGAGEEELSEPAQTDEQSSPPANSD